MNLVRFINLPTPDLATIAKVTYGVQKVSATEKAQNSPTKISPPVQLAICLAEILGEEPLSHPVLQHLTTTALFVTSCDNILDLVNKCGMLVSVIEVGSRTHVMGLMTGSLAQWRDACAVGVADPRTQEFFGEAKNQLLGLNIDLWQPPTTQQRLR